MVIPISATLIIWLEKEQEMYLYSSSLCSWQHPNSISRASRRSHNISLRESFFHDNLARGKTEKYLWKNYTTWHLCSFFNFDGPFKIVFQDYFCPKIRDLDGSYTSTHVIFHRWFLNVTNDIARCAYWSGGRAWYRLRCLKTAVEYNVRRSIQPI